MENYKKLILLYFLLLVIPKAITLTTSKLTVIEKTDYNDSWLQGHIIFGKVNNQIPPFDLMDKGFTLQDNTTTCSFNSIFPVSGIINLNGGKLFLNRDLILSNYFIFGTGGTIYGNKHTINFPKTMETFYLTTPNLGKLNQLDEELLGNYVYSIDWSYNDQYLAAGAKSSSSDDLEIFYFNENSLTSTASAEFSDSVYSVRWHPSSNYLAIGIDKRSGTELKVYYLNTSNGTFTQTSSIEINYDVYAVAWSPNGNFLAAGTENYKIIVYSFSNGEITEVDNITLPSSRMKIQRNTLSWNSENDYIAIGVSSNENNLLVYSFNGSTLTLNASAYLGTTTAVNWRPNSSIIAVGLANTTQRLKIFEHSDGSLTEKSTAHINETKTVYSINWNSDGNYLTIGRDASSGTEFRYYYWDNQNYSLFPISMQEAQQDVYSVRWSNDNQYIARGSKDKKVSVFNLNRFPLKFKDTQINLEAYRTSLSCTTTIEGTCLIYSNKNILDLTNGKIEILPNSNLIIQNTIIRGLQDDKISCKGQNATLILKNCDLILSGNFDFNNGSIIFENNIYITKPHKFIYSTTQTSTINSNTTLYLDKGVTFSYAPTISSRELLEFTDDTSILYLHKSTLHSIKTGLNLTKGTLISKGNSFLSSERSYDSDSEIIMDNGITFGNNNSDNDFSCLILEGSVLTVTSGTLYYKNTSENSFDFINNNSTLKIGTNSWLNLNQNLNISNGLVKFENNAGLGLVQEKRLIGSTSIQGFLYRKWFLAS